MRVKYANLHFQTSNYGDYAQIIALDLIYRRMGIKPEDVVDICWENCEEKIRENDHLILPMVMADVGYFNLAETVINNRLEEKITFVPLCVGQTRWTARDKEGLARFTDIINRFQTPIGCRDFDSASLYAELGYETYVNGCITNTWPRRKEGQYDKIYIIDVPEKLLNYIPERIKEQAVWLTQDCDFDVEEQQKYFQSVERYKLLEDTAKLVITCRYHIAMPCCAMGIPVIMVENCDDSCRWTFDTRFNALNPNIAFYTEDQFDSIDWTPQAADFEQKKSEMINVIVDRLEHTRKLIEYRKSQESFFAESKARFWDTFVRNRHKVDIYGFEKLLKRSFLKNIIHEGKEFSYYLYGLSQRYIDEKRCIINEYIGRQYPEATFLGFVDAKRKGCVFLDKEVLPPEEMKIDEDTVCLCAAYSANEGVKDLFIRNGFDLSHLWLMPEEILFYVYHL